MLRMLPVHVHFRDPLQFRVYDRREPVERSFVSVARPEGAWVTSLSGTDDIHDMIASETDLRLFQCEALTRKEHIGAMRLFTLVFSTATLLRVRALTPWWLRLFRESTAAVARAKRCLQQARPRDGGEYAFRL